MSWNVVSSVHPPPLRAKIPLLHPPKTSLVALRPEVLTQDVASALEHVAAWHDHESQRRTTANRRGGEPSTT